MYLASEDQLVAIVRNLAQSVQRPLLIGHNPGLQNFLLRMSDGRDRPLRERVEDKFPTGALAVLELPGSRWNELEAASGRIIELILPREI